MSLLQEAQAESYSEAMKIVEKLIPKVEEGIKKASKRGRRNYCHDLGWKSSNVGKLLAAHFSKEGFEAKHTFFCRYKCSCNELDVSW